MATMKEFLDKALSEVRLDEVDDKRRAMAIEMIKWLRDMETRIKKSINHSKIVAQNGKVHMELGDSFNRMANVINEDFYEYFWG